MGKKEGEKKTYFFVQKYVQKTTSEGCNEFMHNKLHVSKNVRTD